MKMVGQEAVSFLYPKKSSLRCGRWDYDLAEPRRSLERGLS